MSQERRTHEHQSVTPYHEVITSPYLRIATHQYRDQSPLSMVHLQLRSTNTAVTHIQLTTQMSPYRNVPWGYSHRYCNPYDRIILRRLQYKPNHLAMTSSGVSSLWGLRNLNEALALPCGVPQKPPPTCVTPTVFGYRLVYIQALEAHHVFRL